MFVLPTASVDPLVFRFGNAVQKRFQPFGADIARAFLKEKTYTMAIANIFGSNLIMLALILPADIAYTDGPILAQVDGDLIGTAQSGLPRFRVADLERQAALMAVAQSDARKLLAEDAELESDRGRAARVLLWLMEQDQAIRLISVG